MVKYTIRRPSFERYLEIKNKKSVLVQYKISMDSVCLKYVNEGEVEMQYMLL